MDEFEELNNLIDEIAELSGKAPSEHAKLKRTNSFTIPCKSSRSSEHVLTPGSKRSSLIRTGSLRSLNEYLDAENGTKQKSRELVGVPRQPLSKEDLEEIFEKISKPLINNGSQPTSPDALNKKESPQPQAPATEQATAPLAVAVATPQPVQTVSPPTEVKKAAPAPTSAPAPLPTPAKAVTKPAITVPEPLPKERPLPPMRSRPSLTTDDLPVARKPLSAPPAKVPQQPIAPLSAVKPAVKPKPILRRNSVTVDSSIASTLQSIRCMNCRNPIATCVCSYERSSAVKVRRPASICTPAEYEEMMTSSQGQFGQIAALRCTTCQQTLVFCRCDHRSKRPGSVCADVGYMPASAKKTLDKVVKEETISYAVEGYLNKYNMKKKTWKRKWMELHDGSLIIFKKKGGRKSDTIPLYSVVFKHFANDETCFEINTSKQSILVAAASKQERERWEDEIWNHKKMRREKKLKDFISRVFNKKVDLDDYKSKQKKQYAEEQEREQAVRKLSEDNKKKKYIIQEEDSFDRSEEDNNRSSPLKRTVSALKRTASRRTLVDFRKDSQSPSPPAEHNARNARIQNISRNESKKQVRFHDASVAPKKKIFGAGSP